MGEPRDPKEPVEVIDALRKFVHTSFPMRSTKDWDSMSGAERAASLRETVEHLEGCTACQFRIPKAQQAVIKARYRTLTNSD